MSRENIPRCDDGPAEPTRLLPTVKALRSYCRRTPALTAAPRPRPGAIVRRCAMG